MDEPRLERIRTIASDFHLAAQSPDMAHHPGLHSFPQGSCRWASFMLAQVLSDFGEEGWVVRCGEQGPEWLYSHCWLEREGYILDVTADQVKGYDGLLLHLGPSPFESVFRRLRSIHASDIHEHPPILEAYRQIALAISAPRSSGEAEKG